MAEMITGVFHNRTTAASAVDRLEALGYEREEISVLMHDNTMAREFAEDTGTAAAGQKSAAGAKIGAGIGGALAAIVGGMAAKSAGQSDKSDQRATSSSAPPQHSGSPLPPPPRIGSDASNRVDDLSAAPRSASSEPTSYGASQRGDSSYVVTPPSVGSSVTGARAGDTSSATSQSPSSTPQAGSLSTPVVGGPLAATLAGAGLGGLIGALAGAGVDKKLAERYEKDLNSGGIVIGVAAKSGNDMKVRDILRNDTSVSGTAGTQTIR